MCSVLELDNNEAAVSLCVVAFSSYPTEPPQLAVGTTQGMSFYPRQAEGGSPRRAFCYRPGSSLVLFSLKKPFQEEFRTRSSSLVWRERDREV